MMKPGTVETILFKRILFAILSFLLLPLPDHADVTITQRLGIKGQNPVSGRVRKIMIKGQKMRIESQRDSGLFITVFDLDAGREMVWESKGKVASVFDLAEESTRHKKDLKLFKTSVQPTGETKQVLGVTCQELRYELVAAKPPMRGSGTRLTGTICVSHGVPGSADFAQFAQEAKSHGYLLGATSDVVDPLSVLFLAIADLDGLPLESSERYENSGFMVAPGAGVFTSDLSTEAYSVVTDIANDPLSEELFRTPDGRKIKKDRSMGLSVPIQLRMGKMQLSFSARIHTTKN